MPDPVDGVDGTTAWLVVGDDGACGVTTEKDAGALPPVGFDALIT